MKKRPEEPFVPPERGETIRQEIIALLDGRSLSAREISSEVGIAIREVYEHLAHVRKTVSRTEQKLAVKPAECKGCGFVFTGYVRHAMHSSDTNRADQAKAYARVKN